MWIASGRWDVGRGTIQSRFGVERGLRVHVVRRRGLVFDSRFVVPAPSSDSVVYLIVDGTYEIFGPPSRVLHGPCAFMVAEDAVEGGPSAPLAFRSHGDPFVAIDVRTQTRQVIREVGRDLVFFDFDAELLANARQLSSFEAEVDVARMTRALLEALARRSILDLPASETAGGERWKRVWKALGPLLQRFHALPTLDEVSASSGWSVRQVSRDLEELLSTAGLRGGWRDTTRRLRLKLAVLGLSAADASITEVARRVGYRSEDAMARAFRDAGLPPPSAVRRAVLAETIGRDPPRRSYDRS